MTKTSREKRIADLNDTSLVTGGRTYIRERQGVCTLCKRKTKELRFRGMTTRAEDRSYPQTHWRSPERLAG